VTLSCTAQSQALRNFLSSPPPPGGTFYLHVHIQRTNV
jgi:hypothetical protein